jgi:hypothetical protein
MSKYPTPCATLALLGVVGLLSACVSIVQVKPATEDSDGIHYYLPQVFIQITPSTDGSFKVEPVYLPDPANRYSVKASSYLGNYTIDINRSPQGFLETVSFNSDNTGIAKQLISTQAALRATEIETQTAKAQKDATEAKAAADKQAAKVTAAEEAQKTAAVALDVAKAKLALLTSLVGTPGAPEDLNKQILAARIVVAEVTVKHDASIVVKNAAAANFAAANGTPAGPQPMGMTPAFLKVEMTKDSVSLKQPFPQDQVLSWKIPVETPTATELALRPAAMVTRPDPKTKAIVVLTRANKVLRSAVLTGFRRTAPTAAELDPEDLVRALQFDQTTIQVDFPKTMAAGKYRLTFSVDSGTAAKPDAVTRIIDITIER